MLTRLATLLALLSLLTAAPAMGKGDDPEPSISGKRYASPKAVFDAYAATTEKKDYKTALGCLTPEAVKDQAAFTAYVILAVRKIFPDELKKSWKPLFDAMDRHGLTEEATKDLAVGDSPIKLPEKARLGLRKLIKKPGPFMLDMAKASAKLEKEGAFGGGQMKTKTTLEGLKVQGNKASGKMVTDSGPSKMTQKVEFVKMSGGWKMVPATEYDTDAPPLLLPAKDK
jgi:hypothetical protein